MRSRVLALGWFMLTACAPEPPPTTRVPELPDEMPDEISDVVPDVVRYEVEGVVLEQIPYRPFDARAALDRWMRCHPEEIARFEFGPGEDRVTSDAGKAEIERIVARLEAPPGPDGPIAQVLIMGQRSADEQEWLDEARAGGIRNTLLEADVSTALLSAAGFEVPDDYEPPAGRVAVVFEVCGLCCIL